ncbi:CdaR family transcriptional regulator [Haloimpatiens sp. FM7315]|uniref:CdaR family transcriptional regulator n=1 Tax=Haloimpatiens sp. FM7315 TaxID=3298609 RepID=UPI0035A31F8D
MISLTSQLAQDIVNKMMKVIPYNVNIMNSKGIIIGSGDKERIGKIHEGAVNAISLKKLVYIYEDNGDVKKGVNMPIYFKDNIMGVIGISGNPDEVKHFASIVTVTSELLINQEYMFKEKRTREQIKDQLLYQWAFCNDPYNDDFIETANSLSIDINLPRCALAISSLNHYSLNLDKLKSYLTDKEYAIRLNSENIILLLLDDKLMLNYKIKNFQKELSNNAIITIGEKNDIIAKSVHEALRSLEIIKNFGSLIDIQSYQINYYKDIIPLDALFKVEYKEEYKNLILKLKEEGKNSDLIKTLLCYIKHSGEMITISKELHIHRNSLNYRIEKIKNITGKDPKNYLDLLHLITGLIIYTL